MAKLVKRLTVGMIGLAMVIIALSGPASADIMTGTVLLTNINTIQFVGTEVTVNLSTVAQGTDNATYNCPTVGGCTLISVQLTKNPLVNTPLGIDNFLYNTTNGVTNSGTNKVPVFGGDYIAAVFEKGLDDTSEWSLHQPIPANGDGFGSFNSGDSSEGADNGGVTEPIYFTLATIATFTPQADGGQFVVHYRFAGIPTGTSCSGWTSDGTSPSPLNSEAGCVPTQTPEPSSSVLLGVSLAGIGLVSRKILRTKRMRSDA